MKIPPLSQAIRLGAMLRPQGFGAYLIDGATCGLGAALDAIGILKIGRDYTYLATVLWRRWPILLMSAKCPVCGVEENPPVGCLSVILIHLNDSHRWSRERQAAYVQTIEEKQTPHVVTAEPELVTA